MLMMMLGLVLAAWASEKRAPPASPSAFLRSVCCRWVGYGGFVGMRLLVAAHSSVLHGARDTISSNSRVRVAFQAAQL